MNDKYRYLKPRLITHEQRIKNFIRFMGRKKNISQHDKDLVNLCRKVILHPNEVWYKSLLIRAGILLRKRSLEECQLPLTVVWSGSNKWPGYYQYTWSSLPSKKWKEGFIADVWRPEGLRRLTYKEDYVAVNVKRLEEEVKTLRKTITKIEKLIASPNRSENQERYLRCQHDMLMDCASENNRKIVYLLTRGRGLR